MEIAYRYDCLYFSPCADPAGGADPWAGATTYTFTDQGGNAFTSKTIWVWVKDNDAKIRFTFDGVNWGDAIYLWEGDQPIPLVLNAQSFQIQNATAGSNAIAQVLVLA